MTAYLISHNKGARSDIFIEDPELTLTFENGWAVFRDRLSLERGSVVLAIPAEEGVSIQRVDEDQDAEPAPQKE
ncbi:hypothetical protein [Streptomyces niveus]